MTFYSVEIGPDALARMPTGLTSGPGLTGASAALGGPMGARATAEIWAGCPAFAARFATFILVGNPATGWYACLPTAFLSSSALFPACADKLVGIPSDVLLDRALGASFRHRISASILAVSWSRLMILYRTASSDSSLQRTDAVRTFGSYPSDAIRAVISGSISESPVRHSERSVK
jgi:hypothetical protein